MADPSGLLPPPMDSSGYGDYLDMQRKQALASMLMQNTQRSIQTPSDWNSMKVVPRKSILSSLAGVGSAYASGKAQQASNQAQLKYMGGLFGDTPQAPQQPQAAPAAPPDMPPESIRAPGYQPPPQAPTPGNPTLQNSMIPPGMSHGMAARLWMTLGPQGYAEKVLVPSQMGTPEWQTLLRATRGNTDQAAQLLLMKSQKGTLTDVRPGGTLVDPTGNPMFTAPQNGVQTNWLGGQPQASAVPGAASAAATMAGATDAAKAANTLGNVPTGGGGSKVGYLGDLLGPPPGNRPPAMGLPGVSPLHAEMPSQAAQPTAPAPSAPAQPKPYFGGAQQPSAPSGNPWGGIPKLPISSSLGAPDLLTKGVLEDAGKKHAALSSEYGTQADLADQKLQYNNESRKALSSAEVGPSSEWLTENRARLKEWGVPDSLIPGSGTVTPTMELNKNLKQSALQGARAIFGSRMTQMEVKLQHEELSPSTSMTKDAISSLMNQDDIKQQYAKQRAEDYGKYFQHGGNPLRFESWYAKNYPLTRYAAQQTTPQPAVDRLKKDPSLTADFKAKYGWSPYPGE